MSSNTPEALFTEMSCRAAATVMSEYSTSFSIATRLLSPQIRMDIRNLYAVVRIADEIVDGAAAHLSNEQISNELQDFRNAVYRGITLHFSANPAIHAFALTVQRCSIPHEYLEAFFDSMERDLQLTQHNPKSRAEYIYGSAEVIGLMCLHVFTAKHPLHGEQWDVAKRGAQALGAAFQNINFLRDLGADRHELGREYIAPTAKAKNALITEIRQDLSSAYAAIPLLPISSRTGVLAAYYLFSELAERLDATPVEVIATTRVRVPGTVKAKLTSRAIATAPRLRPPR